MRPWSTIFGLMFGIWSRWCAVLDGGGTAASLGYVWGCKKCADPLPVPCENVTEECQKGLRHWSCLPRGLICSLRLLYSEVWQENSALLKSLYLHWFCLLHNPIWTPIRMTSYLLSSFTLSHTNMKDVWKKKAGKYFLLTSLHCPPLSGRESAASCLFLRLSFR